MTEDFSIPEVQNVLTQVKSIKEKSEAVLDATGERFNIFKVLGLNQYETEHSKILAAFLNPKGTHGMKARFLELFLEECFSAEELKAFDFKCANAIVKTESYAPTADKRGRIDILITSGAKRIIIENKLRAGDQSRQLKRYQEWSKNNSADFKILYLTKDGHFASEQSGEGVEYKKISYGTEIINWLEKCCVESAKFPLVRESLVQYANLIRDYTGGSMSAKAKEEIIDLLTKDENIEIARMISMNFRQVKIQKAKEIFAEMDKIVAKTFGTEFSRTQRAELGEENFLIKYEIKKLTDVNLCIVFEDNTDLIRLKCNLSYKGGKSTAEEEKSVITEKYRALLADIPNQIDPTEYSAWRMAFDPWVMRKAEILEAFEKVLKAL